MYTKQFRNSLKAGIAFFVFLLSVCAHAEPSDTEKAAETARNGFIERFLKFTQDKNVMGKARMPDGKAQKIGKKTRFNSDDGNAFQSDLTYHDLSFNINEQQKGDPNDKNAKVSRLFAFVSPHGGLSQAGGSSILERTAYQNHQKFSKQDTEENNKKDDSEKGIKYRSIFKISTQEVFDEQDQKGQQANGGQGKNDKKGEPDKVERFEVREEVRPEIDKVGADSFETVRRAARDEGKEDDSSTLSNGVLLRVAAGAASEALWNSTLANLTQRRVNRGIKGGAFPDTPQLSEGVPTCDQWASTASGVVNKVQDKGTRDSLQQELGRMSKQCKQMVALPYNVVNPRFEADENSKKGEETLKQNGVQKEDAIERDSRVQLEVLNKAGKDPNSVPSNWKYEAKDNESKVVTNFDENGNPAGEETTTVRKQIESYNNQLQEAAQGISEVKARMPDLKMNPQDPLQYQIAPESVSVMKINQPPASAFEEVGIDKVGGPRPSSQNYNQLLQNSQK